MPDFIKNLSKYGEKFSEIGVAFGIVGIIGLIMIPIQGGILDFLLVINITVGIIILLLTLFTTNVLQFSTFPTLLLVTTMFRLGLNISSTRLILSTGDAGKVIDAFANFVTGNNYIVGAIIFIIIVIVNMLVVTAGSSRVAEVSARFTLDAMPGKQMAIDADLNSGLITEDVAKKRREDLQREANFYGAMDGASKFVKGDAVVGIIITLINLIGGVIIFSMEYDMPAAEALSKFGKLTIGDGLVGQVPALLISIASGVLVTRSVSKGTFGSEVVQELFHFHEVILIAAVLLFVLALVPAFPTIPFLFVSLVMGAIGYLIKQDADSRDKKEAMKEVEMASVEAETTMEEVDQVTSFQVEPLSIEIGYGLIPLVDESAENNLTGHIVGIRKQCAQEIGLILKPIRIRDNLQLGSNEYIIKIRGNEVARGDIYINKYMVIDPGTEDFDIEGIETVEPSFGLRALWVDESLRDEIEMRGYTIVEPVIVLVTHLKEIIKKNSYKLLGRQEVKELLELIKEDYDVVVDELIPDILTLGEVQKVLQKLLKENVPINDLVTILEVLADNGTITKDIEVLTDYVRAALGRTIVSEFLDGNGILPVLTIDPRIEELIAENTKKTLNGSIPILKSDDITSIFDSINTAVNNQMARGIRPVILASPNIRASVRNLTSHNFSDIAIISLNEVPNDIEIESVGMVEGI